VVQSLETPISDVAFGTGMLLLVMVIHAAGVRMTTGHVLRRSAVLMAKPSAWRADGLMITTVGLLLGFHIFEMEAWSASLSLAAIVPDLHQAQLYACNAYTTLGQGGIVLADRWKLLTPFVAMSGIFAFGWSGSVLVDLVGRCQKIRDAAING